MSYLNRLWNFKDDFKNKLDSREKDYSSFNEQDCNSNNTTFSKNIFEGQRNISYFKNVNNIQESNKKQKQIEISIDNNITELKTVLQNLSLGDKLELSNGKIVYYIKTMSPDMIWVTPDESQRFNKDAAGYTVFSPVGSYFNIVTEGMDLGSLTPGQSLKIDGKEYIFVKQEGSLLIVKSKEDSKQYSIDTQQIQSVDDKPKDIVNLNDEDDDSTCENKISENHVAVVNEIRNLLYSGGINSIAAYFGINQLVAGQDKPKSKEDLKDYKGEYLKDIFLGKGNLGFLQFKASGSKLKRGVKVKIALNDKDLYDITFYKMLSIKAIDKVLNPDLDDFKIIKQYENVYFDDVYDRFKDVLG